MAPALGENSRVNPTHHPTETVIVYDSVFHEVQCAQDLFKRRITEREREREIMGTFQSVEVRLSHTYSMHYL